MINVILCGGSGTRLWPLSREAKPKQFIHFQDTRSLLQRTVLGNRACCEEFMVVCNQEHHFLVQQQLEECQQSARCTFLEAVQRNTSAAICFAMFSMDADEVALITPADHYIDYSENYYVSVKSALSLALNNELVIFGIKPHCPDTGFGYIEVGEKSIVTRFHEKPIEEVAKEYLEQGNYYWNSGMIAVKAGVFLDLMKTHAPLIYSTSKIAFEARVINKSQVHTYNIPKKEMSEIPSDSIDYALLEKMQGIKFVTGEFRWSDIGSFDSLFSYLPKNEQGNVVDAAHFSSIDSKNNLIIGSHRMISILDVENLVVVDTPDALLISKLGGTQKVREIVRKLKEADTSLHKSHLEEHRPWGSFTVLESFEKYKVKRLVVNPGKRLSLQKHQFRSEHWTVVSGIALVTVGEEQITLYPNQFVFIPLGEVHRVHNIGTDPLVIIEVQYGETTREDDIFRLEDDFARELQITGMDR